MAEIYAFSNRFPFRVTIASPKLMFLAFIESLQWSAGMSSRAAKKAPKSQPETMLSQEWYYSKVLQLGKDALIPPTHRHRE
jgi:hypothetical protein